MALTDPDSQRFFSAGGAARRCIEQALADAGLVRIATAYFEASGYQTLQDTLAGKRIHLLVGRSEGGRDHVADVLNEFEHELASGDQQRRTRALRLMLEALQQGLMTVGVGEGALDSRASMDARYLYHHAKLYLADERLAVVGSANFSYQGLVASREAGITVTDPQDVAYFVRRFDEYFARAEPITADLVQKLLQWLKAYDPFTIYARALLELYGLPEEEAPQSLPPLAPYQRAVVSSVLAALERERGAFLIASTGLGKTIIAAHVVAYLRMQDEIDSVLVACPAGIKEMWRRTMRAARTASEEFSYHTLSGKDRARDSGVSILEHELRYVNEKTLVILDESHHLRNEEIRGIPGDGDYETIRLRNRRIRQAVREKGAMVLLMTATPYSKDQEDVNSQLRLLPAPNSLVGTRLGLRAAARSWQVAAPGELPDLAPCTVLTTPDVVQHFGAQDEQGNRYVEFSSGDRRYFPRRLVLKTVRYASPLDEILVELITGDLLYKQRAAEDPLAGQFPLFDGKTLEDTLERRGRRDPFFESSVLYQFCSSPARVQVLCSQLESGVFNFQFEHQERLRKFIQAHRRQVERAANPKYDVKLAYLIEIIAAAQGQKVTVFCHYLETARRLKEGLLKRLRRLRVETTAEKAGPELDRILQGFAPLANEVPLEERRPAEEWQVLIATGALSEGFNLQDSSILVNYDLPWTVLQLAQRMGRILRPWHEPRTITIFNFVPSTMDHPRLRNARRWQQRLEERGEQHRLFAQIPVLIRQRALGQARQGFNTPEAGFNGSEEGLSPVEQGFEMEQLARELYVRGDASLDLEGVLEFIQNADSLRTSTFYKDLVNIPNSNEIARLPAGIRSARWARGKMRLFVLFRQGGRQVRAGLFDAQGKLVKDGDRREEAMAAIRCDPGEPKAPAQVYPQDDAFDAWIERARLHWAELQGLPAQRVQIVCAMALIPKQG